MTSIKLAACAAVALGAACIHANAQAPRSTPTNYPLLWEIGGLRNSYLYGTIHVADRRVLNLPDSVREAIAECGALYTEVPLDVDARRAARKQMALRPGESLDSLIPADLRERLDIYLRSKGFTLRRFQRFKPWALAERLATLEPVDARSGDTGLDHYLITLAQQQGMRLDALETMREQVAILEGLTTEEHVRWLSSTLDHLEDDQAHGLNSTARLVELYLDGDEGAIYQHLIACMPGDGKPDQRFTSLLLNGRNELMAKRINDKVRTDPARGHFFAIGAGHLGGPQGLLALLAKRGFVLTRISPPPQQLDAPPAATDRERELEAEVELLRAQVRQLKRRIAELKKTQ